MPITPKNPFKGRQYPGEVILLAVRWYLRYPLAYLHVSEILTERGLFIDASCIWRWVQAYAPELDKRCRPHLKSTNKSYRVDETYIKVKGKERYLYRAVDSIGQTIDFLLNRKARCLRREALLSKGHSVTGQSVTASGERRQEPGVSSGGGSYEGRRVPAAPGTPPPVQVLNNIVEQDHRTVKKRVWLAKGYGSFQSAWRTFQGIEAMNMIRKGRARGVVKGNALGQALFIAELFGIAA